MEWGRRWRRRRRRWRRASLEEVSASGHRGAPREARGRLGAKLVQQLGQLDDAGAVRVEDVERRGDVLIGQVVHAELLERVAELLRVQRCTPR